MLYSLGSTPGDPQYPREIGLVAEGKDGALYTTSQQGGAHGYGAVYKVTTDGKVAILHSLVGATEGSGPQSGLTLGSDGNFYGAAYAGARGDGSVFKITPDGTFTVLHAFLCGNDGGFPTSAPVQGKDGNFYGITSYANSQPYGVIYKITSGGVLTSLFVDSRTTAATVGAMGCSLIAGSDGNFYGTFLAGGKGFGSVFKMTPGGTVTALHIFSGTDGSKPYSVIQGSDGNLYGTASAGGTGNFGLVFKLTLVGTYTILHKFAITDGEYPVAGVIQASDGNLYGTTRAGAAGRGVIYKIGTDGSNFAIVHSLSAKVNEGAFPITPLVQYHDGSFYGVTYGGGTKGVGAFYHLVAGLKPPASPAP